MDEFDYLFLEPLLIERITAQVDGLQLVAGVPDLQTVAENQNYSPAVYVIYLGDEIATGPAGQGGAKKIQTVTQNWAVVLAVYSADANGDGSEARRDAGPLLGKLISAVTGWKPSIDVNPFGRSARQSPVAYNAGYFYYPLVFTTSFVYPRIRTWQPSTSP